MSEQEITLKQQLKQRLRENDSAYRYYKTIFNLTKDMIALSDGYNVIDANKTFCDFFSKHGHNVFDQTFDLSRVFLPIDKYGYVYEGYLERPWFQNVLHGEKEHYKVGISGSDFIYTFAVSVTLLESNENVYVITLSDVTDMMSYKCVLEEGIRTTTHEKEEAKYILAQYNQAIDTANLVARCNLDNRITYVNDALCTVLEYQPHELIGECISILFEDQHEVICQKISWETIENGRSWNGILKNIGKHKTVHYFDTTIVPIKDHEERIIEVLSIRHDITEMVRAKEDALHTLEAKTRFFDQVSHELRTPLNAIVNFTDQAIENYDEICEDDVSRELVKKYLQRAYSNAEHLLGLINSLLNIAKVRSGKTHFDMQTHNIVDLAQEAFDNCSSLRTDPKVDYRFKTTDRVVLIECDGVKLKQIITNLISNALKFTSDGWVEVRISQSAGQCSIEVEDTGIGIPQEKLSMIFEPFAQVRDHGFGTGLGLNIVREYAEAMGISVSLTSKVGEGSVFVLKADCTGESEDV